MKKIFPLLFTLVTSVTVAQQRPYEYTLDLTKIKDDRAPVELTNLKLSTPEAIFHMPAMIPGTYAVADYGRYVTSLKAFDKKGRELPVVKSDSNSWKISNAQKLFRITYWVDDILDTPKKGPSIYPMAATNIEEGKNFVVNMPGFFGYLEGSKDTPVNFSVKRPGDFYGTTGLIPVQTGIRPTNLKKEVNETQPDSRIDKYSVENYDRLIDSPLMYSKPDTAIIKIGGSEVLISCYSPNAKITAKEIANTVREVLTAQAQYLGGKLPVEKYAFIFYFETKPLLSYGALEHSYSSFYYMPEVGIDQMVQTLRNFAAHEFFHIVTPLNIHSEEIQHFGFNDPKMSKHLWMYEGVTEYFAGNVQVKYGLITQQDYLTLLSGKMNAADNFLDDVAFTDISLHMLDQYANQFGNVYQKGALIGMCLDIKLRALSKGQYGMQNLMADLSKKYGKDKPFKDDNLFREIGELTYPEIATFLNQYVGGTSPLPFKEVLNLAGVSHTGGELAEELSLGFGPQALGIVDVEGKKKLSIANMAGLTDQGTKLGFKQGDILLAVNSETIPELGPETGSFLAKHKANLQRGGMLSYTVLRTSAAGEQSKVELSAAAEPVKTRQKHQLSFQSDASAEQLSVRKAWLSAN